MAIERKISFFLHFVYPRGFLSYLKIEIYGFCIPCGVDVDTDLVLFCRLKETASADGDAVALDGDVADLPLCQ